MSCLTILFLVVFIVLVFLFRQTSKPFLDLIIYWLFQTGYATVRTKVLSLVASWNEVFKGEYRYNSVKEAYDALKGEGFQFPELNSSEDIFDAARVRATIFLFKLMEI